MKCLYCQKELINPKAKYCSDAHRMAYKRGQKPEQVSIPKPEQKPEQIIEKITRTPEQTIKPEHPHGPNTRYIAGCDRCLEEVGGNPNIEPIKNTGDLYDDLQSLNKPSFIPNWKRNLKLKNKEEGIQYVLNYMAKEHKRIERMGLSS